MDGDQIKSIKSIKYIYIYIYVYIYIYIYLFIFIYTHLYHKLIMYGLYQVRLRPVNVPLIEGIQYLSHTCTHAATLITMRHFDLLER